MNQTARPISRQSLPALNVLVIEGKDFRRTVYLEKATYSIGRSNDSSIVIASPQISRCHATLIRRTNVKSNSCSFWILDGDLKGNRSTNGILVNQKKCLVHELKPGDSIEFSLEIKAHYYTVLDADLSSEKNFLETDNQEEQIRKRTNSRKSKEFNSTLVISEPSWKQLPTETISEPYTQLSSEVVDKQQPNWLANEAHSSPEISPNQSFYDYVTDIPNRTLFSEQLSTALALAKRHRRLLAIMTIDIERFKSVNDTFGYNIGDKVLKAFAERLQSCLRSGDTFARWGGDKFVVLLPQLNEAENAAKVGQRMVSALKLPFNIEKHQLELKSHIGIAIYPQDGENAQTLFQRADTALENSRETDDGYQFYDSSLSFQALACLKLEESLEQAVAREEFSLQYQPQISIANKEIRSLEALLRWYHPELGSVSPDELIALAEKTNLAMPIGKWVLQTACAQNRAWQKMGMPPVQVSVNLSPGQFGGNLIDTVTQVLDQTGLEPRWLELEIAEATLVQDLEFARQRLQQLRDLGVSTAIDDFGKGFSSLNWLETLPVDVLKIDPALVGNFNKKPHNKAIIAAVIALGQSLHLKVVAKGVETEQQCKFLQELDCTEIQGYFFSRPLEREKATQLLTKFA